MEIPLNLYSMRGVVPHHLEDWPDLPVMPPYPIALDDFARYFTYSTARISLFRGLLEIRKDLKLRGISGFQWINGSFVQSEAIYGRDPEDMDILTWVNCDSDEHFNALIEGIDVQSMKRNSHCHVFFAPAVDGNIQWNYGAYWLWLFGHTNTRKVVDEKDRGLAKGFFKVDLADAEGPIILGGDHA